MPEISLPRNYAKNEFTSLNAISLLMGYCAYPSDPQKRDEALKVSNVSMFQRIKYDTFTNVENNRELDNPEKTEEFWNEVRTFLQKHNFEIQGGQPAITPRKFIENFKFNFQEIAKSSLQLPDNAERYLLTALPPELISKDMESTRKARVTATKIVLRLMQMKNSPSCRGGISLTKAIRLLEDEQDTTGYVNSTDIQKAWNHHKKSVHLSLGMALAVHGFKTNQEIKDICEKKGIYTGYLSPLGIGLTLIFAKTFQDWMLSFKSSPHATPRRLVSKKELWTIPDWCPVPAINLEKFFTGFKPIDAEVIKRLGYKRT